MASDQEDRFSPKGNLIARGTDFAIYRYVRGPFQVARIYGRCSPALLQALRGKVLNENENIALDTYSLTDPDHPLVQELVRTARRLRNHGKNLALVNARGQLCNLVRGSASEEMIPFVLTESLLEGNTTTFSKRIKKMHALLKQIHAATRSDPLWKMVDRDGLWLCPYCAKPQDHVRLFSRGSASRSSRDLMVMHLLEDCPAYRQNEGPLVLQDLAERLKEINHDKLMASKESASHLVTRVAELTDRVKEADALRHSMEVASQRQRHLLPANAPIVDGVLFGLGYRPSQNVSGDFYDFVSLPNDQLGLIVGDVSGHGIEAAILMGVAKKLIHIRLKDTADPLQALQLANRDLYTDLDRQTFVTSFVGVFDPMEQTFAYVRAGHNPSLLYNPRREPDFMEVAPRGIALGMDDGKRFDGALAMESIALKPGDLLFFYTDGLTEAMNPYEQCFGKERVQDLIRVYYGHDPEEMINYLYEELDSFCEGVPQEDDVTMLAMKLSE